MTGHHRYYKWELLGLLFLAAFFYYADRAIYGVVLSDIRADLNLNDKQLGLINTVMFFALALFMPLAGIVGDAFSRKWIITISLIFWSCATSFTGLAQSMIYLIIVRSIATAGSESFYNPPAMSLLGTYHRETRAFALSVHQAAVYIGVMTSGYLGGKIAELWGWRSTFYVFGGVGVVLGLLFTVRLKDAPREVGVADNGPKISSLEALAVLFRVRTAILLTIGFTAIVIVNNAYVTWAPRLLQDKFGLSQAQAGHYAMFYHHITALAAVLIGGHVSDRLVKRFSMGRLTMMTVAMLTGSVMLLWLGLAPSLLGILLAMAAYGICRGLYECNMHAALFDVIQPRYRGSAVAIMVMLGFIVGSQSPLLLGWFSDNWGAVRGLSWGFSAFSLVYIVGGLAVGSALIWTARRDRIVETTEGSGVVAAGSAVAGEKLSNR